MTPKITFAQTVASKAEKHAEEVSASSSIQGKNIKDSRDMFRARIEYLLAWAERESFASSLINLQNN